MRRRLTVIGGIIIAAGLVVASLAHHAPSNEPRYEGSELSQWVLALGQANGDDYQRALDTISRVDSNAVPYLIKWIQYERPDWREKAEVMIGEVPPGKVFIPIAQFFARTRRGLLADGACSAMPILNTNQTPQAIAGLTKIIQNNPGPQTTRRALAAMSYMGTKALPALIETLRDPSNPSREQALAIIRMAWEDQPPQLSPAISNAIAELAPQILTNRTTPRDISR